MKNFLLNKTSLNKKETAYLPGVVGVAGFDCPFAQKRSESCSLGQGLEGKDAQLARQPWTGLGCPELHRGRRAEGVARETGLN